MGPAIRSATSVRRRRNARQVTLAAAAAGMFAAGVTGIVVGGPSASASITDTAVAPAVTAAAPIDLCATVATQAGFRGEPAVTAVAVAMAESRCSPTAQNGNNPNGGIDRGLWQINSKWHPEVTNACAFEPQCNADAAYRISDQGRAWTQWTTYNNGSQIPYLSDARAALARVNAGTKPVWSAGFVNKGGPITSGPDAASWGERRLDVFARTDAGNLVQKYFANGAWQTATTFDDKIVGDPTAVASGYGRLDVFYRGADNQLHYRYYRSNATTKWPLPLTPIAGQITSSPDVASWAPDRLDVFARGPAGTLVHGWYEVVNGSGRWRGWEDLGFTIVGDPGAVSSEQGRIDVVFRGTDNALHQIFYSSGHGWSGERNLGGTLTAGPDIASWGPGRLDVVVQAADGSVRLRTFANGAWTGSFLNLGGATVTGSGPSIVSWGPNRLDVFARGSGNGLFQRFYS